MSTATGKGLVGLLKRGWHEIPDVMGSSIMALIGIGFGLYGVRMYNQKDGDIKRYMEEFTVIRHDDPRAKWVRKD